MGHPFGLGGKGEIRIFQNPYKKSPLEKRWISQTKWSKRRLFVFSRVGFLQDFLILELCAVLSCLLNCEDELFYGQVFKLVFFGQFCCSWIVRINCLFAPSFLTLFFSLVHLIFCWQSLFSLVKFVNSCLYAPLPPTPH